MAVAGLVCSHAADSGAVADSVVARVGSAPQPLHHLRAFIARAFTEALSGNAAALELTLAAMQAAWGDARRQLLDGGAPAPTIERMDAALSRVQLAVGRERAATVVARSVNFVTVALLDLLALFEPPTSIHLLVLDYLARELVVDALQGEFAAAALRLSTLERTWAAVAPRVIDAGGSDAAEEYRWLIEVMSQATRELDNRGLFRAASRAVALHERVRALLAHPMGTTL